MHVNVMEMEAFKGYLKCINIEYKLAKVIGNSILQATDTEDRRETSLARCPY